MPGIDQPYRDSRRWQGFDYRAGRVYFVTICTAGRQPLLSRIDDRCRVRLHPVGLEIVETWEALSDRFPAVQLLAFVAMSDHVHGLIEIVPSETGEAGTDQISPALSDIVGAFSSLSARNANRVLGRRGVSFWQRGYYDRVIRTDDELERSRWYIEENPARWAASRYTGED